MDYEEQTAEPRRVLVVDDDTDVAALLTMLVNLAGYDVRTAHDGKEAIAVAEEFAPEVVVMDLGMPGMDGLGAARYIRSQHWGENMLLIALTGWGQEKDRRRTAQAGFDVHLVKPVKMAELQCILRHFKRGRENTDEEK